MKTSPPLCPVCRDPSIAVTGEAIYPHRPDLYRRRFFRCQTHTDYYVGTHRKSGEALGVLANKEHRRLKILCHRYFDPHWKERGNDRSALYQRLSDEMGISLEECHFGMFSFGQLREALEIVRAWPTSGR